MTWEHVYDLLSKTENELVQRIQELEQQNRQLTLFIKKQGYELPKHLENEHVSHIIETLNTSGVKKEEIPILMKELKEIPSENVNLVLSSGDKETIRENIRIYNEDRVFFRSLESTEASTKRVALHLLKSGVTREDILEISKTDGLSFIENQFEVNRNRDVKVMSRDVLHELTKLGCRCGILCATTDKPSVWKGYNSDTGATLIGNIHEVIQWGEKQRIDKVKVNTQERGR